MKTILVSLISAETIPNVQFIKEMKVDEYLFITTEEMERNGVLDWIKRATNIENNKSHVIIVSPFAYEDIEYKLAKELDETNKYIVNLTGGTKVMSLVVNDVFRTMINSEMYYLTGDRTYSKIYPRFKDNSFTLSNKLTLKEYIIARGFEIKSSSDPVFKLDISEKIFEYYLNSFNRETDAAPLKMLLEKRNKNIDTISDFPELVGFIERLGFKPTVDNMINKKETKFLTGDWFEEYMYYKIMAINLIDANQVGTGWNIVKNDVSNEFDILFLMNDRLNVIECKTSIWKDVNEEQNIIADTIYKVDSLKNKFGLFAKTSIVTLSDLTSLRLKDHLKRANEYKIAVLGRDAMLDFESTIKKIL
jgi:hypothetical protein